MSISRITADVNPKLWNTLRRSTTKQTPEGICESFNNGYKLLTDYGTKKQTVIDPQGNTVLYQILDKKSGKSYII